MWNNIIQSLIISVIAALIFSAISYSFVEKPKIRRVRRKLNKDLANIRNSIHYLLHRLFVFPTNNRLTMRGVDIDINEENIGLALLNKCINDTYKYYPQISSMQISWGKELAEHIDKISEKIRDIYAFYGYLSAKEILLLNNIREQLNIHNPYKQNSTSPDGFRPLDPSMFYLRGKLWELYKLSTQLDKYYNITQSKQASILSSIKRYCNDGQYIKCKKETLNYLKKWPNNYMFVYLFLNEYKNGDHIKAYDILEQNFRQRADIVGGRSFYTSISKDEEIERLMHEYYDESELEKFYSAINDDKSAIDEFFRQAKYIRQFIKNLNDNHLKNGN